MITTVTLNASIDKAYHMTEKIENGTVMRVAKTDNSAGGKGLNVARVINSVALTQRQLVWLADLMDNIWNHFWTQMESTMNLGISREKQEAVLIF